MKVETYECEEITANEHPEVRDESMKIIDSLGLVGQQKLNTGSTERNIYRKMTADESTVYGMILPKETALEAYSDAPIPLRVLQVAAHAKPMFDSLVVMHPASADEKDPVLLGIRTLSDGYKTKERYMLARWGDVLEEWPALVKKAGIMWKEKAVTAATEIRNRAATYDRFSDLKDVPLKLIRETYLY